MPRRKGQRKCGDGVVGVAAETLPARYLKNYLCELGPRYCPLCFSKCAFGERYMALRRAEKQQCAPRAAAALQTKGI